MRPSCFPCRWSLTTTSSMRSTRHRSRRVSSLLEGPARFLALLAGGAHGVAARVARWDPLLAAQRLDRLTGDVGAGDVFPPAVVGEAIVVAAVGVDGRGRDD